MLTKLAKNLRKLEMLEDRSFVLKIAVQRKNDGEVF